MTYKTKPTIPGYLGCKVYYDKDKGEIFASGENDVPKIILQIRGLRHIEKAFQGINHKLHEACKFQDEMAEWVVDAINSKLKKNE